MIGESVYVLEAPPIVFGAGASDEIEIHLDRRGVSNAMIVCDPYMIETGFTGRLEERLRRRGIAGTVFPVGPGEPSEASILVAIEAARARDYDGFVGVGGGSALDTAKLCALFATHDGDLFDYVNQPIGRGKPIPGPLPPLICIPTTAGTGSEMTTVAIIDLPRLGAKTGISHRYLRPSLAVVDPLLTLTCPPRVTASVGLDALLHAIESYTARPYHTRPAASVEERPPYQGAHPLSDLFSRQAIAIIGAHLRAAVADGGDVEARTQLALAATIAGIGFGAAGVHLPHALAYPVASLKHAWESDYPGGGAFVPHGFAVAVTAPASFRFIEEAVPDRCREVASLLDGGGDLAESFERLLRDLSAPMRLSELGYTVEDVPDIVQGALKQRRLLVCSPRDAGEAELTTIALASL